MFHEDHIFPQAQFQARALKGWVRRDEHPIVATIGLFTLPKGAAAIALGATVYWDASGPASGTGTFALGTCAKAAAASDATVETLIR